MLQTHETVRRLWKTTFLVIVAVNVIVIATAGNGTKLFQWLDDTFGAEIPASSSCSTPLYGNDSTRTESIVRQAAEQVAPAAPNLDKAIKLAQEGFGTTLGRLQFIQLCPSTLPNDERIANINGSINLG